MSNKLDIGKIKQWGVIFATVVSPIIVVLVGYLYTQSIKEREVQGKFVELAVGILRTSPTEDTKNLREWAFRVGPGQVIVFQKDMSQ